MADISNEIKNFREAVYGEEVRGSMISLAEKLNEVSEATEEAEKKRVTAENGRVSAETKRQTDTAEAIKKNNAATERANTAASAAETATEETNRATENANEKAALADTAAKKADAAAKSANDAAGTVEAAKTAALEAAELATSEAGKATAAASNANSKASAANTAAGKANTAAERAEKAAEHAEGLVLGDISEKTVTFEMASQRAGVESGDTLAVAFGKLAKYCADLKPHVFVDPVNNLLGTDATLPLAATQGKALDEKIEGVKADVTELNGKSAIKTYTSDSLNLKSTTKLNEIIEGGLLPQNSLLEFWVNDDTEYKREIRKAINTVFSTDFYGFCFIYRSSDGTTRLLKCIGFDSFKTYVTTYTEVNSVGWMDSWIEK